MSATVFRMGDHRAVFVLPASTGTVVFLASRGPSPRISHEQVFAADSEAKAAGYAAELSLKYECPTIGAADAGRGEDVA